MPPRRGAGQRGQSPGPGLVGRGGGAVGRGGAVGQPNIAAHVKTIGVRRPGYGAGGQEVDVIVNAFPVTVPDGNIFQYDVAITPDNLPAARNMKLFQKLHTDAAYRGTFQGIWPVYDGRKIAYTVKRLPLGSTDSASFDVPDADGRPDKPPRIFKIKLTIAREINAQILHRYINGQQSVDIDVYTAISAMNVATRMYPNQRFTFNTRSFFVEEGRRNIGKGIELWRGYFQSIRPTFGKMYVNIDIATAAMYRPGILLDTALQFCGETNPNFFSRMTDRDRIPLQRFLAGIRVKTLYTPSREVTVKRLSREGADKIMFKTREGRSMSVADYFRTMHNRPLKFPRNICIEIAGGAAIPLDLCEIAPGQIMRKAIPQDKTRDMVDFSKMSPTDRLTTIKRGFHVLQYQQSDYVRQFGISVDENPMTVKARILPAPTLKYGPGSRQPTIAPRDGAWNMRDKLFYSPSTIKNWVVVIYESQGRVNSEKANEMIKGFMEAARTCGVRIMDNNPLVSWENGQGNIGDQLTKAGGNCRAKKGAYPDLILVVLPEYGNDIYIAVKHFGDVVTGVATQCVKSAKARGANIQYWANVMLKVNVKLGGVNAVLERSALNDPARPTIVMGADTNHPQPGVSDRPSFTALVSSVDSNCAKYVSSIRVQEGRVELIEDLEEMVKNALQKWTLYQDKMENNKKPPARIVFYRDGVSEGQFEQVLDKEVPKIRDACAALKLSPKLTLIIVGKRHHIRMFPRSPSEGDRSGNCRAGTTIDKSIGHPTEFDYYQLSHGGLLGTSRPSHYSVILDENSFTPDAMQLVSFSLCHVYARATRSVSIPAPVYYADIVCDRAKTHFDPNGPLDLSETGTHTTGRTTNYVESFKNAFKPLNPSQAIRMYFM